MYGAQRKGAAFYVLFLSAVPFFYGRSECFQLNISQLLQKVERQTVITTVLFHSEAVGGAKVTH